MTSIIKRIQRVEGWLLSRTQQCKRDFTRYRTDPVAYCGDVLHVTLTPQQEEICKAHVIHKQILVPSANETGKSFLQACLASWHYDCFNPGLTIITGPVHDQIRDTVFAELRMLRGNDRDFAPAAMRLESGPKHWVKGYTARTSTAFQGRHEGSVFVLFEEAEDIDTPFWVGADSMADIFSAWYNPILGHSEAAVRERNEHYHVIRLNALEHPNIAAGLCGAPPPIPKAVTLEKVITRLDKWATRISVAECTTNDIRLGDKCYRPGPIAEARILGRRPRITVGSVFTPELWDKILATVHNIRAGWPIVLGVDTARFGDDFSGIHGRVGLCSVHHESHNGWRETEIAERVMKVSYDCVAGAWDTAGESADSRTYRQVDSVDIAEVARRVPIHIDDAPCGGGVQDILYSHGYNVVPINSASTESPDYPNLRSQLWFDCVELVNNGLVDLHRLDPDTRETLRGQLLAPEYEYVKHKGRIVRCVEEKKVTKRKLGRSPDDADAMLLCYFNPQPVRETYA